MKLTVKNTINGESTQKTKSAGNTIELLLRPALITKQSEPNAPSPNAINAVVRKKSKERLLSTVVVFNGKVILFVL